MPVSSPPRARRPSPATAPALALLLAAVPCLPARAAAQAGLQSTPPVTAAATTADAPTTASPQAASDQGPMAEEEDAPLPDDAQLHLADAVQAALQRAPGRELPASQSAAAAAYRARGRSLLAGAPSLMMRYMSDAAQTRQNATESEAGLDLPLWRWGARSAWKQQAQAQADAASQSSSLQIWLVSGAVREAYWDVQEARQTLLAAQAAVSQFQQLEDDVRQRIRAGDAAANEAVTAESQRRAREAAAHEAEVMLADRCVAWRLLTGLSAVPAHATETPARADDAYYPPLAAAQADVASASAALHTVRSEGSGSPRLQITARRDTQNGNPLIDSVNAQLTVPFGGHAQTEANAAPLAENLARARDTAAQLSRESQLAHHEAEHELHARGVALADAAALQQLAAADVSAARRAWQLGEMSLAERVLAEVRAADAQRQYALAQVAHARAIARFNQINGAQP